MQSSIEYKYDLNPQALIEIADIGQFAIQASNDDGFEYYFAVVSDLGFANIYQWGPVFPDNHMMLDEYSFTKVNIPYKERKIELAAKKFLNNYKYRITEAKIITIEEASERALNEQINII